MTSSPEATISTHIPDPRRWRILSVLLVAMFMSLVGVSIVNVVLPSIQIGLDASASDLQWVLSGYALTFGVVLVAAGRAGDIFGRAPLFIAGVALFTLSSVAAGLAPDPLSLNIARFIQGLGSGLLNPQGIGLIQQYFRGAERGRAYGLLGSVVGVSVAIGPLLGGFIIELLGVANGWRWTFLVNVPFGILTIVLALMWFPRPLLTRNKTANNSADPATDSADGPRKSADLDIVGSVLLGAAVLALLLPFVERSLGAWGWGLGALGLVLIAAWVRWEAHYKAKGRSPMVDLDLFATASFSAGTTIGGMYFLGVTAVWALVALYVQNGLGQSALFAGMVGLPAALMSAVTSNWAGKRVMTKGRKIIIWGILSALGGVLASIGLIPLISAGTVSFWWLVPTLTFIGVAQGLVITPNQTLTLAEVPLEYSGSAGGILQTSQRIGGAMGLAVVTGAVFAVLETSNWATAMMAGRANIAAIVLATLGGALQEMRGRTKLSRQTPR